MDDWAAYLGDPPGEAAAAPLALFGFRVLVVAIGELVLARAPLIVSSGFGLFGYIAGTELSRSEAMPTERNLMHTVGPFLGAGVALFVAEAAGRLMNFTRRRSA